MPTDKRQRQREGREARRAAARAAQRRAARRRQIISVIALFAVVGGIGFGISRTGSGDEQAVAADRPEPKRGAVACPPAQGAEEPRRSFPGPPKMCLEVGRDYTAVVTTDIGDFTIALDPKRARETVNNFVFLARYRAYEDVPFHRVIPGFVVQGGDVAGQNGAGDAGYKFADELPEQGEYKIGSVAMANSGAGTNTNGSQFFVITGEKGVALEPHYSLFGTVTEGMEVVKAIEADGSDAGNPTVVHKIVKVTINEKEA